MFSDDIKKFFHGDVLTDEKTLDTYSRDYSIFKVRPQVVVFPKDAADVKNIVKFAAKTKKHGVAVSLTGRSAGTDMTGGPLNDSIIVAFGKYFNHVKEIGKNYAVVEPGVYFRDFEKQIATKGLFYPPYPASKDLCAMGGIVNNNSGGEKTLACGKTEDYVEELKIVLSDGELHAIKPLSAKELKSKIMKRDFEGRLYKGIYELIEKNRAAIMAAKPKVSKNSAGYYLWNVWDDKTFDLTKLIVGAQGTLGLVTEAKLRLLKAKKYSRLAVIFLNNLAPVSDLVVELLKFKPESLESYDDKTLEVALRFLPEVIKSLKGSFFSLIWKFIPEALMALRGGLPKMVMLVELTADEETDIDSRFAAMAKAVKEKFRLPMRIMKDKAEEGKYWVIRRQSFALLHNHSLDKDTAPFIDDFIVEPKYLPEVLPKVNAILNKYKDDLIYTIAGHPGDGNFHIIPLMDLKDPRVRALIPKISEEVYKLILQYHGSITAEHNDGLVRTPYLKEMYGEKIIELFAEVKRIFDPLNIFNPGKKVGVTLDYSLAHVAPSEELKLKGS